MEARKIQRPPGAEDPGGLVPVKKFATAYLRCGEFFGQGRTIQIREQSRRDRCLTEQLDPNYRLRFSLWELERIIALKGGFSVGITPQAQGRLDDGRWAGKRRLRADRGFCE